MAPPVYNEAGDTGDLSRAVAHLEEKQEEMRQDMSDVKDMLTEIQRMLKGDTEAPEKSLLWRLARLEEAERRRSKILGWVLGGAFTAMGATLVGWMVLGAKNDKQTETQNK